jgi:hypothetical protein
LKLNGGSFVNIQGGTNLPPEQRSFTFPLPNVDMDTPAVIRVRADDKDGNRLAVGDSPQITIRRDSKPPAVQVILPNGGEKLKVGDFYTIQWQSSDNTGVIAHEVKFSPNGGNQFADIASLPGTVQSFTWLVPEYVYLDGVQTSTITLRGVIRVVARDASGNRGDDRSDGFFQVQNGLLPVILNINPKAIEVGSQNVQLNIRGQNIASANTTFTVLKAVGNGPAQETNDINLYCRPPQDMTNGVTLTVCVSPNATPSSSSVRYFIRATQNGTPNSAQSPELTITAKPKESKEKEKDNKDSKEKDMRDLSEKRRAWIRCSG